MRALFTSELVASELREQIESAYADLGGTDPIAVAVRSSATAEDLENASFAGQQDTFLWVIGIDAVLEKVIECWSSLFTPQVIGYRRKFEVPTEGLAMAVVVQTMVPAESAGSGRWVVSSTGGLCPGAAESCMQQY